jgi:hypothetical protein
VDYHNTLAYVHLFARDLKKKSSTSISKINTILSQGMDGREELKLCVSHRNQV